MSENPYVPGWARPENAARRPEAGKAAVRVLAWKRRARRTWLFPVLAVGLQIIEGVAEQAAGPFPIAYHRWSLWVDALLLLIGVFWLVACTLFLRRVWRAGAFRHYLPGLLLNVLVVGGVVFLFVTTLMQDPRFTWERFFDRIVPW